MSMMSSPEIIVNKESTSKLAIHRFGSCLQIHSAKLYESLMVQLFTSKSVESGRKTFASL